VRATLPLKRLCQPKAGLISGTEVSVLVYQEVNITMCTTFGTPYDKVEFIQISKYKQFRLIVFFINNIKIHSFTSLTGVGALQGNFGTVTGLRGVSPFFYTLISSNTTLRYMFAQGRTYERRPLLCHSVASRRGTKRGCRLNIYVYSNQK
jgi:hypothetical protein